MIAFSASKLRADPAHAALAAAVVGPAPVGLALVDHGRRLLVAVSNQFGRPPVGTLALIDTAGMLAGGHDLLGVIPARRFPRELAITPDAQTAFLTNFGSGQVEAVPLRRLP